MPPIFTDQYAREQRLQEEKRSRDAERISNLKKSEQGVLVYAFYEVRLMSMAWISMLTSLKDGSAPVIVEFQEGFIWPHFVISYSVLEDLDLYTPPSASLDEPRIPPPIKLYNQQVNVWTKIKIGHVVTLKAGSHIFLKAVAVTRCEGLDSILSTTSTNQEVHHRRNLAGARKYVRERIVEKAHDLSEVSSVNCKGKARATSPIPDLNLPGVTSAKHKGKSRVRIVPDPDVIELTSSDDDEPKRSQSRKRKRQRSRSSSEMSQGSSIDLPPCPVPPQVKLEPGLGTISAFRASDEGRSAQKAINIDGSDDGEEKTWPGDFFVVDVVDGFVAIKAARKANQNAYDKFREVYGVPWSRSTYYDHLARWKQASDEAKERAISAGRNRPEGLWSTFMASNPAKDADIKASRRRFNKKVKEAASRESSGRD